MGRAQIHKTHEARKAANTKSKDKARKTKEQAGLKPLNIDLDKITLERLDQLCIKLGYDDPEKKPRSKGLSYSNVIGALIRLAANEEEMELTPSKPSQELYRVYSAIDSLRKTEKTGSDIWDAELLDFLNTNKYPRPNLVLGRTAKSGSHNWKYSDLDLFEDKEALIQKMRTADHLAGNASLTTSKKTPEKPHS